VLDGNAAAAWDIWLRDTGRVERTRYPSSCEVDIGNAVVMQALQLASGRPPACLDWNNNYGDDENKCILFHCGPVPKSLMAGEGHISDHAILANAVGQGCGFGCHVGRIAPQDFTFGSLLADAGKLKLYLGEGSFTPDPIPAEFFGCAGVAEIPQLQKVLMHIGRMGYRHHVSLTPGKSWNPCARLWRGISDSKLLSHRKAANVKYNGYYAECTPVRHCTAGV
jgi:L-fucose isomerase-like protein